MNMQTTTEYRNLPIAVLTESAFNPRRVFQDAALKEPADSIRVQGVLSPLLVRPITEQSFEIVAGGRRYRAAQMAEAATVPVRIVNLTDAQTLEMALVENLIRADVHPMRLERGHVAEFGLRKLLAVLAVLGMELNFTSLGKSGSLDELRLERQGK